MTLIVEQQVQGLEALDLEDLREQWRVRYGAPPSLRSVGLLRRLLAWKIQADAFGGLDADTRRRLRGQTAPASSGRLAPGTLITREWKGVAYVVEATEDGFLLQGRTYRSLSEVARAITGTRWNGPRFFGLRAEEAAP